MTRYEPELAVAGEGPATFMGFAINCQERAIHIEERDGYDVEIVIDLDRSISQYVASSVKVSRRSEGSEVTAKVLRTVTVQEVIAEVALRDLVTIDESGLSEDTPPVSALEWLEDVKAGGLEALRAVELKPGEEADDTEVVGMIYTLAKLGNWPPLATVATYLGVSQSTATRMVARARKENRWFRDNWFRDG
ncbi:helix-turn-helix domain-containing protein [Agrococcus baldri]|nr:hypothetical protein [Agrococcus baldri]